MQFKWFFTLLCVKFSQYVLAIVLLLQMSEHLQKECRLQSFTCTFANCTFKVCAVVPGFFPY